VAETLYMLGHYLVRALERHATADELPALRRLEHIEGTAADLATARGIAWRAQDRDLIASLSTVIGETDP
jgi:hypothetical protein